jgi:hypothetical protein
MAAWLARRERNGWGWAELSRHSGHPVWKLRWWHERLKRKPLGPEPRRPFLAVEIREPVRAVTAFIEITTPTGYCVQVRHDFDPEHLRRLLNVLEPAC